MDEIPGQTPEVVNAIAQAWEVIAVFDDAKIRHLPGSMRSHELKPNGLGGIEVVGTVLRLTPHIVPAHGKIGWKLSGVELGRPPLSKAD